MPRKSGLDKLYTSRPTRASWSSPLNRANAMSLAQDMGMRVDADVVDALLDMRDQVMSVKHASCPANWVRHTESVENEHGIVWRDQDGHFCAPPGAGPAETLVPPEDAEERELRKRILEMSEQLDELLDPES